MPNILSKYGKIYQYKSRAKRAINTPRPLDKDPVWRLSAVARVYPSQLPLFILDKICTKCRQAKPVAAFRPARKPTHNPESWCRDCKNSYLKQWRLAHPTEAAAQRNKFVLMRYGMTPEEYDCVADSQSHCCAICGRPESIRETDSPYTKRYGRLHVDHDAKTGHVRGLLCGRCNRGIGMFLHDPETIMLAAEYMKTTSAAISALPPKSGRRWGTTGSKK